MRRSTFITWAELRVGILVVVGLAVLLAAILTLGGRTGIFESRYNLHTLLGTASGLQSGAPVRLAGVNVGTVNSVEFIRSTARDTLEARFLQAYGDSLGDRAVLVEFSVNVEVQDKLTRSSRAKVGTVGLLGDKYLDLEVGDPRDSMLIEGDIVLNALPIDYEGLIERAAEGVDELVSSLEGTRELVSRLNRGEGTLGRLMTDPALYDEWVALSAKGTNLLESMQTGDGTLPALLNDRQLYDQLVATTADLQALTGQIREGEGTLGRLVQDPALYDELVVSVQEGKELIAELRDGDGTMARLVQDPELYERLTKFVLEAEHLIADIQSDPKKYINLKVF